MIWDLGGVLLRTEEPALRRQWEHRLGLRPGELHDLVFRSEISLQAELGRNTAAEVWQALNANFSLDDAALIQLEHDFWAGDRVDQQLIDFITGHRGRLRMGLLSNTWAGMRQHLSQRWPIADAFDEIVISAEIGAVKPQPAAYQHALARLDLEPGQTLFIDDATVNIVAARQLGMQAILFRNPEDCLAQVQRALN